MRTLIDDLRLTLRQLRRAPGFLFTAVLTLSLAIAANVVVFGIANSLLIRPLPVPQPQQLVQVQGAGMMSVTISYPNFRDLQQRTHTFQSMALARMERMAVTVDGVAQPVWGYIATGAYFQTLGIQPQLGRFFTPAEDVANNAAPVIVLSDILWRNRFNADPNIIGKTIQMTKHPYTVIGVGPRGFHGTEKFIWTDVWVPFHQGPEIDGYDQFEGRGSTSSWLYARLNPGVNRAQADADLRRVSLQLSQQYPGDDAGLMLHTSTPGLIGDTLGGPVRGFIGGIMLLALLVLLAACANLGVLFSSRTADRARELGIRLAIGSTRGRILRQLLTESVVISILGGSIAALLATVLLRALSNWRPSKGLPAGVMVDADWTVYAFALALSLGTGLLFGILPARQTWQTDPNRTMRADGSTGASTRSPFRSALLLIQIALCCLLLTASFVSLQGLRRSAEIPLGVNPQGVTIATMDVHLGGYDGPAEAAIQQRLLVAAAAIPGVTAAGISDMLVLSGSANSNSIYGPGTTQFDRAHIRVTATSYRALPNYFAAAGTRLLRGRDFSPHDIKGTQPVSIVNQTFARKVFGSEDVIGRHFPTWAGHDSEVIGVIEDGKYNFLAEDPEPAYFRPLLQNPDSNTVLLVRSNRPSAEMVAALRHAVQSVDSSIPIFGVGNFDDSLAFATFPARAATLALGTMGLLAVLLAVTGIFGVASYTVARRMREFGIRVALGANTRNVLSAALGRTLVLLAIGSVVGLALGIAATRLLRGIVYHATVADPLVLAAVLLTMATLGTAASLLPARRALQAEPAVLLRDQ